MLTLDTNCVCLVIRLLKKGKTEVHFELGNA